MLNIISGQIQGLFNNLEAKPDGQADPGLFSELMKGATSDVFDVEQSLEKSKSDVIVESDQLQQEQTELDIVSDKGGKNLPLIEQNVSEFSLTEQIESTQRALNLGGQKNLLLITETPLKDVTESVVNAEIKLPVEMSSLNSDSKSKLNNEWQSSIQKRNTEIQRAINSNPKLDKIPPEVLPGVKSGMVEGSSQSGQSVVMSEKPVDKSLLADIFYIAPKEEQSKSIHEIVKMDNKTGNSHLEANKNNLFMEDKELSEFVKPEFIKRVAESNKQPAIDNSSKTDFGQMVALLKHSKEAQKNLSNASNNQPGNWNAEFEPLSATPKLTIAANNDASINPVKPQLEVLPSSMIQSGLSLNKRFSSNLAMRIQWVFQQAISSAEILMDPPELGPMSVKLSNNNGETNILFQVSNSTTKDTIEENLAKLKELLAEQGISLGDAQVEQQQKNDKNENQNEPISADSSFDSEQQNEQQNVQVQQGLLDTYI